MDSTTDAPSALQDNIQRGDFTHCSRRRELSFGLAVGIAVAVPLLGRSLLLPGQVFSIAAVLASFGLWLACQKRRRLEPRIVLAFALTAIYLALVLKSSHPDQWAFLMRPSQWSGHSSDYIRSKLVVFLVVSAPPMALAVLFSFLQNRRDAFRGILAGIIAISVIGMIVTIAASDGLYRSDYDTAADWYMGRNRAQFSIISMGILFILGGIASCFWLAHPSGTTMAVAAFIGMSLFGVSILIRRVDTILFIIALLVIGAVYLRQNLIERRILIKAAAIAVTIPALLWPIVSNEFSVAYWANFVTGYSSRADAAVTALDLYEHGVRQGAFVEGRVKADYVPPTAPPPPLIWGIGLGFYAAANRNGLLYPHNVLIETFLESGPMAAVTLLCLLLTLLVPIGRRLYDGTASRHEVVSSAAAVTLFLAALKTGDITSVGPILFFSFVAASLYYGSLKTTAAPASENVAPGKLMNPRRSK